MLVLSRKNGEEILIGSDVCITVVEVRRGRVRLGIVAPKEIPIVRTELHNGLTKLGSEETHTASRASPASN